VVLRDVPSADLVQGTLHDLMEKQHEPDRGAQAARHGAPER
jgi:hypothetical protein